MFHPTPTSFLVPASAWLPPCSVGGVCMEVPSCGEGRGIALPTTYPPTGAKAIFIKGNSDHHLPALNPPTLLGAYGRCPNSSPRVTRPQVIWSLPTCPNPCSVAGPSLPGQPPRPSCSLLLLPQTLCPGCVPCLDPLSSCTSHSRF